jgi:LPXTG-motif cell wall-anchored protein
MDNLPKEQSSSSNITSNVVSAPQPPRKNVRNQIVAILLIVSLGVVAAFGTFFVMNQMDSSEDLSQVDETRAWAFSASAESYCDSNGVKIKVTFRNTEPQGAQWAMNVTAKDNQSGKEVNLGTVNPGQTVEGYIDPEAASINAGTVTVRMVWTDGRNGVDNRNINYSAQSCTVASASPSASPSVSPSASVRASRSPSASPSVAASPSVSPSPSPSRSPSASPSPSLSPSASVVVSTSPSPSPSPSQITQASIPPAPTGDGQSDNLGCSKQDCSGNEVADNKAVANAGTSSLPDAGIPAGPYLALGGILFLASGLVLGRKKKY